MQELMRQIRHNAISDQVRAINAALPLCLLWCCRKYPVGDGALSVTGARCCAVAGRDGGRLDWDAFHQIKERTRYCIRNCGSHTGGCGNLRCCEATAEERGAVAPHATFCGNRGRATASGDPVESRMAELLDRDHV